MKKFLTVVYDQQDQVMYAYTETREQGFLQALAYIASFSVKEIANTLEVKQTTVYNVVKN